MKVNETGDISLTKDDINRLNKLLKKRSTGIKDLFSNKSELSSMRVMAFIIVLTACAVSIMGIVLNRDIVEIAALVAALLAGAFGGKVGQAKYEAQVRSQEEE